MKITEDELAIRKRRIIDEACRLFCEYGIDSVPLKEVAKKSAVSVNSIFRYFDTKAGLIHCTQKILWQEVMLQILSNSKDALLHAKNGFEEIRILLINFKKLYEEHGDYLLFAGEYQQFLVHQHIRLPAQAYNETLAPVLVAFTAALKRGHDDGSISKLETVETQFFVLWGVMRGYVEQIVFYDQIYKDNNPLKNHFELVLIQALKSLSTKIQPVENTALS